MGNTATAPSIQARETSLPLGPRNAFVQFLRYMRHPYRYHQDAIRRYGDTFLWPGMAGRVVMTADPELLRTLFALEPSQFKPFGAEVMIPVVGENSLVVQSGATHKRERKLLMPPFHGARMHAYGRLMQEVALEAAGALRPGETFTLADAMQDISLRIILRAVFGLLPGEQTEEVRRRILDFSKTVSPPILYFTFLQREFFGRGPWARFVRARQALDEVVYEHIRARRAAAHESPPGENILSLLLGARYDDGSEMSDVQVRDQLFTLLLAGHDTSARGLSWLLSFVFRQPEVLHKLRAEMDALGPDPEPETVATQPYLEAVCQEALRLYPVATEAFRQLCEPLELGPYVLPAGIAVAASIYGVHRRPELYPDGETFRPERFLERKFSPFEYLPFGGGNRRCLGAAFAMYEMKMVAYALVRRYDFRPANEEPPRPALRGVMMGPHDGAPMELMGPRR